MTTIRSLGAVALSLLLSFVALAAAASGGAPPAAAGASAADHLIATLEPPLATLATEVLEHNPDLARLESEARAADERAPQVRALPDPMASVTAFLAPPETRVGPQEASLALSQRFPWFGKLGLREREATYRAAAAHAAVEAKRLALVTEVRRLAYELAFLGAQEEVVRSDRATLSHYEELARARYASGVGLEQAAIKLQAEISKDDNRLLEIGERRVALAASLAALGDRAPGAPLPEVALPAMPELPDLTLARLEEQARGARPEVARARALIAAAGAASELARKEYKPDWTLGLGYTRVGDRRDAPGRAAPPPGNGDDIVGLMVGVNLPVHRQRLAAGVAEAAHRESAAEEGLRSVTTSIDGALGDLAARLPLIHDQLRLFEQLLSTQATEALRSAEAAYAAGTASALDLLDAERVLLEIRIATARNRADYQIAWSRLEGAVGAPLAVAPRGGAR